MGVLSTAFKVAGKTLGFGVTNPIKTTLGTTLAIDAATGEGMGTTLGKTAPAVLGFGADTAGNMVSGAFGGTAAPGTEGAEKFFSQLSSSFGNSPGAMIGAALGLATGDGMMGRMMNMVVFGAIGHVIEKFMGPTISNMLGGSPTQNEFNKSSLALPSLAVEAPELDNRPAPAPAPSVLNLAP